MKTANPKTWKPKHRIVWETANGSVPKGHTIIFADGNRLNISIDNLLMVTRAQLAIMNKRGLISNEPEATKAGILVADIFMKISERKRKGER